MFIKPSTQYTKSGSINIAYQVFGSGTTDLVYIPGWISNIDWMWACPELVDFLLELGKVTRVILFDKRGTGLSDRVSDLSSIEERMDDLRAVMDAVNSKKAILFGHSEGGSVSALFSATYPERTIALITFGVFAKRRWSPEYPWAPTDEEREKVYQMIENHWGSGSMNLESLAPTMKNNKTFMDWLANYFRSGASPSAALVLTKMNTQVDIIDILDTITVPTLLMFRTDDIDVKVEEGKFISERIKDSKFVEFPGNDHLFWVGDSESVLTEMKNFIKETHDQVIYNKVLSTILLINIRLVTKKLLYYKDHDINIDTVINIIKNRVAQYRGSISEKDDNLITATFDGPSKAVHCSLEIRNALTSLQLHLPQGLHIGECVFSKNKIVGGSAIKVVKKVLTNAKEDEILITNTVNNLMYGSGLSFKHYGHIENEHNRVIPILSLSEKINTIPKYSLIKENNVRIQNTPSSYSFLENVLQSIENNLENENYNIEILCLDIGVSERQLQRKLKSITNKSPNQLIRSVRLHRAKEMIALDGKSLSEAASRTGFNSLSYFSKCFKKEFNQSPSSFIN